MSLRARLALFIALTVAFAVITQGLLGYVRYHQLARTDLEHDLNEYLLGIADKLVHGNLTTKDNQTLSLQLGQIPLEDSNIRVRLMQGNTEVHSWHGVFPKSNENWYFSSLALPGFNTGKYHLEGALGLHEYQALERRYRENLVLTVPLMAGFGALLAWILSASALRPLEQMVTTASKVAASGNLLERVPKAVGGGELEHLGTALNKMLERLQAFRERETMFVRYAAHELRTPLAAMQTQFDAQENGWVSETEALTSARKQVERMTKLSQALLVLAREERVEMQPFDLGKIALETAKKYNAAFEGASNLEFTGNAVLLTRALENLLENVQRHAENAKATVKLELQNSKVILSVSDDGEGISSDVMTHATEAFFHSDTSSGSGLGLAVVKRISEAHNAGLTLENLKPHGLSVKLEFPKSLQE